VEIWVDWAVHYVNEIMEECKYIATTDSKNNLTSFSALVTWELIWVDERGIEQVLDPLSTLRSQGVSDCSHLFMLRPVKTGKKNKKC
jgi:hypothetical protein